MLAFAHMHLAHGAGFHRLHGDGRSLGDDAATGHHHLIQLDPERRQQPAQQQQGGGRHAQTQQAVALVLLDAHMRGLETGVQRLCLAQPGQALPPRQARRGHLAAARAGLLEVLHQAVLGVGHHGRQALHHAHRKLGVRAQFLREGVAVQHLQLHVGDGHHRGAARVGGDEGHFTEQLARPQCFQHHLAL